ncbi:M24 family metallopeptidase [Sphingomonas sp. GCM10030256]|uniref:M24 family metallopeptidase n=1 Tax=Sphingomonas sp. GCM10030256 TaxID=3273427 RepID=UPI0036223F6A
MPELDRRTLIGSGLAAALPLPLAMPAFATNMAMPPAIGRAERESRLRRAQQRMQAVGIGSILVEPGASLDYLTGVQWRRSERVTAAVIPARGAPIIVTPFFERPSVAETLGVDAEIRVWQEHEDPAALVAGFLRERRLAGEPVGMEESVRWFVSDGLRHHLPRTRLTSADPVIRALRMIKSPAELALMNYAAHITQRALRLTHGKVNEGMSAGEIGRLFREAVAKAGGEDAWALVLIDEASALPHGTGKPQQVKRGSVVLMDCGCGVHGYQADISRTFVFDADPTREQRKVWEQVRRGQDIVMTTARVGVPAGAVDDAVRRAYESWGYGPDYRLPGLSHRTGHGIGMEGHEPVNLVRGETTRLAPGMCFSNEPGIYRPGEFGVRLEDCFHMTAAGPKWFTTPPPSIDRPFG